MSSKDMKQQLIHYYNYVGHYG